MTRGAGGRLSRAETVLSALAVAMGLLAVFWPSIERYLILAGSGACPYLAGNPGSPPGSPHHGSGSGSASGSGSGRFVIFENAFVLMSGEDGRGVERSFIVDTETGRFASRDVLPADGVRREDLEGAIVTPGFVDPHVHFISTGLALLGAVIDVRDVEKGADALRQRIASALQKQQTDWAVAYGYLHEFGDASWLDDVPVPTVVFRFDSHQLLANRRALQLASISADTASPEGGAIRRDASGAPTGVLCDAAMGLLTAVIPSPSSELLWEAYLAAERYALQKGVTRVGDMGRVSFDDDFASFDDLTDCLIPGADGMRIRVDAFVSLKAHVALKELIDALGTTRFGGDGKLRVGGVKDFYDGSLSSRTALFTRPYKDGAGAGAGAGIRLVDPISWEEMIRAADSMGLTVATHAIGSQAVDEVLSAYERLPRRDAHMRHRIEHAQHVSSIDTIRRMAAVGLAGVTPNPQHLRGDRDVIPSRLHDEDARYSYPLEEFRRANVNFGLASDAPVVPLDPLGAVAAAMDERNRFALGAWDALFGVTRGAHLLSLGRDGDDDGDGDGDGSSDRLGFIADGFIADFVVHGAECDASCTFDAAVERLIETRDRGVKQVYVGGKHVAGPAEKR
jgi:predicted amidohydrolase YtcJ